MKTVYALSSGEYSSYHVAVICLDKALAERLREKANLGRTYDRYDVEEFKLVESEGDLVVIKEHIVEVDSTGRKASYRTEIKHFWGDVTREDVGSCRLGQQDGSGAIGWSAKGYQEALKAARDKLAEYKEAAADAV